MALILALVLSLTLGADAQTRPGTSSGTSSGASAGTSSGTTASRTDDGDSGPSLSQRRPSADVARVPRTNRPEFVTIGPPRQAQAAADALRAAGARVVRSRSLPNLRLHLLTVDLQRLPQAQAQAALADSAPSTVLALQHLYRYAQGTPRLYAAGLVGQDPGRCPVRGLRIGQIDGPVARGHPALAAAGVTTRSVLLDGERPPGPNHGTAVAALMVGQAGALTGYAAGAQLFAAEAFARESRGPAADVERIGAALDWLVGQRVRLVNMSFAGPVNAGMDALIGAASARGAVMIAAAGNDRSAAAAYPAAAPPVIAVTAVDARSRAYRSANTGAHIEFAAPGVDLYVATGSGASYASGTSYAAPIVTGIAAQLAARGGASASAIRRGLQRGAQDLGPPGRDAQYGWGMVRAPGC